ncbi:TIGR02588 family protein [Oryzicola mucosus]|uniref:TIGR02588 family protein n=1 Tax=Oryzicola mucosus TaxID=2767425 RepID=A0A8J6U180_9HYPH|nr:TIGR02588 family protein [Oryzicola mucosus]MBD0414073.1 TIGR02588 family protein [Oryzicola mucosus]
MSQPVSEAQRPMLEWIVGGIAAGIVAALIVYLGYKALEGEPSPPDLAAAVERIEQVSGGWLVRTTLNNSGGETAAAVLLKAELRNGTDIVEEREITFDYVPANSARKGAFLFTSQPATAEAIAFVVQGYSEP